MSFVAVRMRFGSENGLLKSELHVSPTLKPCSILTGSVDQGDTLWT